MVKNRFPGDIEQNITRMYGATGLEWLESLPEIFAALEARWNISIGPPFENLSYNFTAPCVMSGGRKGVVKLGFPGRGEIIAGEASMLRYYDGSCFPELFEYDSEYHALLIEGISPGQDLMRVFAGEPRKAVAAAVSALLNMPRSLPPDPQIEGLPKWFAVMDNDETGPIPADLVKKAKAVFEELYTKNAERFLLHGDFHHGNILSDGDGFRVIDPEGAIGPIGYEIAVFLNEHSRWMRGKEKAEQEAVFAVEAYAEAFSAEPNDLCEWAFCQMMLAQCWDVEDFGEADPSDVEMAARWLEIKEMIGGKGADET